MSMKITIDKPGYPASGHGFRISGHLSGYSGAPKLSYADDPYPPGKVSGLAAGKMSKALPVKWSPPTSGMVYHPLPSPAHVTAQLFHFRHPGLTPGHHTVVVTDGKTCGIIGFGVQNAIHARVNPFVTR
jgi:hypothetical protein